MVPVQQVLPAAEADSFMKAYGIFNGTQNETDVIKLADVLLSRPDVVVRNPAIVLIGLRDLQRLIAIGSARAYAGRVPPFDTLVHGRVLIIPNGMPSPFISRLFLRAMAGPPSTPSWCSVRCFSRRHRPGSRRSSGA